MGAGSTALPSASIRSVLRLAVVVVERLEPSDQADPTPEDLVRAGVVAHIVRPVGAVGEKGHASCCTAEVVRDGRARPARDDVTGAYVVGLFLQRRRLR